MALNLAFCKILPQTVLSATEADKEPSLGFSFQVEVASRFEGGLLGVEPTPKPSLASLTTSDGPGTQTWTPLPISSLR